VLTAPQGKLDALAQFVDSNDLPHGVLAPQWKQATFQQLAERNARQGAAMLAAGRAQSQAFSRIMYSVTSDSIGLPLPYSRNSQIMKQFHKVTDGSPTFAASILRF
jgi:hypothetical protein